LHGAKVQGTRDKEQGEVENFAFFLDSYTYNFVSDVFLVP